MREEEIRYGISQVDGGTRLERGGDQNEKIAEQNLNKEQFQVNDNRSLSEVVETLLKDNYLPSFCTACYRRGRTGEHFMEFSVPGFIKRYCTPNARLTLAEYLGDYAQPEIAAKGWEVININMGQVDNHFIEELKTRLQRIKEGERDIYF